MSKTEGDFWTSKFRRINFWI